MNEEIENELCTTCNGSGEGMYEGSRCSSCGGGGEARRYNNDDYEYEEQEE